MKATNWVGSVVGRVNLSCRTRRIVFPLSILGVLASVSFGPGRRRIVARWQGVDAMTL
jgi:hypothetical protein